MAATDFGHPQIRFEAEALPVITAPPLTGSPAEESSASGAQQLAVPPAVYRADSTTSYASDTTLGNEGQTASDPPTPTFLDQPITAEPVGEDVAPVSTERRPVGYLSPMPVYYFLQKRYAERPFLPSTPEELEKEPIIGTVPARNQYPPREIPFGMGWVPVTHPEGQLYFQYQASINPSGDTKFFTNNYLYDEDNLGDIEDAVRWIEREIVMAEDLPPNLDVCLDIYMDEDGDKIASYYMCNCAKEEMMWFKDVSVDFLIEEVNVRVHDQQHLKLASTLAYWYHIQMFPNNRVYSEHNLQELCAVISYHLFDSETSRTSTSPYSSDELARFMHVFSGVKLDGDCVSEYHMAKIARMKTLLVADQVKHYHGTKWARLDSNRSVIKDMGEVQTRSWWFSTLSWMLFSMPSIYVKRLDQMWVDISINHQPWRKFVAEIQDDWAASITPSAVILTANVGFLAIQSVDQGRTDRSAGQIVSYISTLLSIGNILACTILARQHRPGAHLQADTALEYLVKRAGKPWQAELLTIVLSIPTAFFIWGLIAFSSAILWVCLDDSSWGTRVAIIVIALITAALLGLVMRNGDWVPPAFVHTIPTRMKEQMQKITIQRLSLNVNAKKLSLGINPRKLSMSVDTRQLSLPLRKLTGMVRRTGTDQTLVETGMDAV
ncbi:hypothetical protein BD413DRAFT_616559 [Trametes elegans]|nr:hypothetical protein BD413DRAFT_616559 [Trametes elegans]